MNTIVIIITTCADFLTNSVNVFYLLLVNSENLRDIKLSSHEKLHDHAFGNTPLNSPNVLLYLREINT